MALSLEDGEIEDPSSTPTSTIASPPPMDIHASSTSETPPSSSPIITEESATTPSPSSNPSLSPMTNSTNYPGRIRDNPLSPSPSISSTRAEASVSLHSVTPDPQPERVSSPNPNPASPQPMSPADLDRAKSLVLDLLGWGVPPEYLVDSGVSSQVLYKVFTDLKLRLPANLDLGLACSTV